MEKYTPTKIPLKTKLICRPLGRFWRGVETEYFVYFCNYNESDENGTVIMYRKQTDHLELVSDNFLASNDLVGVLERGEFTYLSPTMKENYKLMRLADGH